MQRISSGSIFEERIGYSRAVHDGADVKEGLAIYEDAKAAV